MNQERKEGGKEGKDTSNREVLERKEGRKAPLGSCISLGVDKLSQMME